MPREFTTNLACPHRRYDNWVRLDLLPPYQMFRQCFIVHRLKLNPQDTFGKKKAERMTLKNS